jgi:hypothetical protein
MIRFSGKKKPIALFVLVIAVEVLLSAKKKEPKPLPEPPPGHVHSFQEGLGLISASAKVPSILRPGASTFVSRDCVFGTTLADVQRFEKAIAINDEVGVREVLGSNTIKRLAKGTSVLILEIGGLDVLTSRATELLRSYSNHAERMIRACGGMRTVDCVFPLAPVVITDPLVYLSVKVRAIDGDNAEMAGWLYPKDIVLDPGFQAP